MTSTDTTTASKTIMIVDDEPDICLIFKKSLELAGYDVLAFTEPLLAPEHFKSNADRCGLIVSDVRMHRMNGIELAARIRKLHASIPIMLMSFFELATLDVAPALNVTRFLEKPLAPSQLKEAVSKHVQIPAK